jgi:hypothetical protein
MTIGPDIWEATYDRLVYREISDQQKILATFPLMSLQ